MPVTVGPTLASGLGEQIADALRVMVIWGELLPGERLVETSLADSFHVSRGPIRDAFKTLEHEGLVRSSRRGTFVIGLSEEDVAELFEIRGAIESLAIRRVVARRDRIDWTPFEVLIDAMRQAASRGDNKTFSASDMAFHAEICRQSGNRRAWDVWWSYEKTLSALLERSGRQGADLIDSAEDHASALHIYRTGTPEEACVWLTKHLAASQGRLGDVYLKKTAS